MASSSKAPGQLELVREFVNSVDIEDGVEQLDSPQHLRAWLERHGLEVGDASLGDADVRRAIEVREALRALLLANSDEPLDRGAVETLNAIGDEARLLVRFEGDGRSTLAPAAEGVDAALGQILAIVFQAMAEGTWQRLKACESDTCRWAFYDRSRNRSGTWCSMAVCGNRAKARAYRERHKHAAA